MVTSAAGVLLRPAPPQLTGSRALNVERTIGASDRSIRQIIVEGIVIGLLSWLIGAALAWPVAGCWPKQ